jgi:hypothetical protein
MPDVMRTFNNVIDENIGIVGEKLNSLNNLDKLFTAFTSASTRLNEIDTSIGKVDATLNQLVLLETKGLKVQVTNLPRAGTFNADELTEGAFNCIRALVQVQNLVTDKSWFENEASTTAKTVAKNKEVVSKNNTSLRDITTNNSSYDHCLLLLKDNKSLLYRFKQQFTTQFQDGNINELGERFLQIQVLNSDLVSYFAPHNP